MKSFTMDDEASLQKLKRLPTLVRRLVYLLMLLALLGGLSHVSAENDFLEPEQAFQFSSRQVASDKIEVQYKIADGYYMYRERYAFNADGATLGEPVYPKGEIKFDETFQKNVETYRNAIAIQIPLTSVDKSKTTFTLRAQSQGCSDRGLCYVPIESTQTFAVSDFLAGASGSLAKNNKDLNTWQHSLQGENLWVIIPLFALLGVGLAFTPCVLPMVPILSSIIIGEGAVNKCRSLVLSLSYSSGMVIVYTALGIAAGLLGEGLAASLQNRWVLGLFAVLLAALSLSMFNVYHLQIPTRLQNKLSRVSNNQRAGKVAGVFVMGAVSAFIVSPCVAAPLASALLYISQTRNVLVGGAALFSMALGMSIPLILVGVSAGALLPRVGRWMESVKQLFGVLMLALALWLLSSVLPDWLLMLGWSGLFIGYGVFLFRHPAIWMKLAAIVLVVVGVIELAGVTTGSRQVLSPIAHWFGKQTLIKPLEFVRIQSIVELDQALALAKAQGKFAMLDFYADWCVACKEMEKWTFIDERVHAKLAKMALLRVDVTANSHDDRALLKRFNLFGPPGVIFFGLDSKETGRVIGFENASQFLASLPESVE